MRFHQKELPKNDRIHIQKEMCIIVSECYFRAIIPVSFAFHLTNIQGLYSTYDRETQIRDGCSGIHVQTHFIKSSGL